MASALQQPDSARRRVSTLQGAQTITKKRPEFQFRISFCRGFPGKKEQEEVTEVTWRKSPKNPDFI
jgi:hypothetical protein